MPAPPRPTGHHPPKTKLSGRKICPKGPERTESMVPGSRSTSTARGTYLPPAKEKPVQPQHPKPRRLPKTTSPVPVPLGPALGGTAPARPTGGLVVIDVDAFELEVAVAVVRAGRVDAMLVRDHLPELRGEKRGEL